MLPPCKLFGLRGHGLGVCRLYGRAKGDLQKDLRQCVPPRTAFASAPADPASTGDPHSLTGRSSSVSHGVNCFFLLGPSMHKVQNAPSKSLFSLVLWNFYNQIPQTCNVRFSGESHSVCQIPKLGILMWGLEHLQQSKNFFGIIVLQFVGWRFIKM